MYSAQPNEEGPQSPGADGSSMRTPSLTPEGSQRGSEYEFVEVGVDNDVENDTSCTAAIKGTDERIGGDNTSESENLDEDADEQEVDEQEEEQQEELTPEEQDTLKEEEADEKDESTIKHQPSSPVEVTVFDPDGDLVLINNAPSAEAEHHFRVSSRSLAFSSSVWKVRISSVSSRRTLEKEGKDTMTMLVRDDTNCLTTYLRIVHLQFSALPTTLKFMELYRLARFSEKYSAHEVFLPFMREWIEHLMTPELLLSNRTGWILISWEFCLGWWFEEWLERLCRESSVNSDGSLTYGGVEVSRILPQVCREEYEEYIQNKREAFLNDLISISFAAFSSDLCVRKISRHKKQCNALKDGYLMASLNNLLGEWQWPLDAWSIDMSASNFKEWLLQMESVPLPRTGKADHSRCGVEKVKKWVAEYSFETKTYDYETAGEVVRPSAERFTKERREVEMRMFRRIKGEDATVKESGTVLEKQETENEEGEEVCE